MNRPHLSSHWQQTLEYFAYASFLQPPAPGPCLPSTVASPCPATAGLSARPLALNSALILHGKFRPLENDRAQRLPLQVTNGQALGWNGSSLRGNFLVRSQKKSGGKHLSAVLNCHGGWAIVDGCLRWGLHINCRRYPPPKGPMCLLQLCQSQESPKSPTSM